MEDVPYNSKQINGLGFIANPVDIPAANATVEFIVFERNTVTLSGGATMEMSPSGDLSKVAPLGDALLDFTFDLSGELTRSQTIYFGVSETGFSFDSAGDLTRLALIPAAILSQDWESSGELTRISFLSGNSEQLFDLSGSIVRQRVLTGSLTKETSLSGVLGAIQFLAGAIEIRHDPAGTIELFRPNYIGYGNVGMSIGFEGNLSNIGRLSGAVELVSELNGSVLNTKLLSGDMSIQWNVAGLLANNAGVSDLKGFLMARRKTNREMLR